MEGWFAGRETGCGGEIAIEALRGGFVEGVFRAAVLKQCA
jgi:hypothetical protein